MSEAPEKILAWPISSGGRLNHVTTLGGPPDLAVQYIRADLVEAAVKRAIEACAEAARAYCHFRTVEGRALKSPAVFTTHTGQDLTDAFRALAKDPEAIAKIMEGDE